jgi:hypothetical protein
VVTAALGLVGAPGLSWLDSGELLAAASELGNIHPPGHPAWLSSSGLVALLPLAAGAARLSWLSALFGGVAAGLVVALARLRLGAFGSTAAGGLWAAAAGLTLGASGSLWLAGDRIEVYTLALASNLWALWAAARAGRAAERALEPDRAALAPLVEVVLAGGLGLLNHHWIALFATPAVLVAAWPALVLVGRRRPRWLIALALLGLGLGLGYLAPALRAGADTEMRWGDPATPAGLWDTVSARHFQRSLTAAEVSVTDNLLVLLGAVVDGLGAWLALAGAAGLTLALLRRDREWLALVLALLGGLLTKALMAIDTGNPDDHGYILMAPAVLALGVAEVGGVLFASSPLTSAELEARRWRFSIGLTLPLFALCGMQALSLAHDPAINLHDLRAPERLDADLRARLGPGTLYLSNYYGLGFNEQGFRLGEGRRPDLAQAHLSFRTGDTDGGRSWQGWFARRRPEWAELALAAGRLGRTPVGGILVRAERESLHAEEDPENRLPTSYYGFGGLVHRLLPARERGLDYDPARLRERQEEIWSHLHRLAGPALREHQQTRALFAWQHALQLARALRRGWPVMARSELAAARKLASADAMLGRLERRLEALEAAWQRRDAEGFGRTWRRYSQLDLTALAGGTEGGEGHGRQAP